MHRTGHRVRLPRLGFPWAAMHIPCTDGAPGVIGEPHLRVGEPSTHLTAQSTGPQIFPFFPSPIKNGSSLPSLLLNGLGSDPPDATVRSRDHKRHTIDWDSSTSSGYALKESLFPLAALSLDASHPRGPPFCFLGCWGGEARKAGIRHHPGILFQYLRPRVTLTL